MSLLSVKEVSFGYDRTILEKISFDVSDGKFISLLGVNGAGKSTLLNVISHFLKPDKGIVCIENQTLCNISQKDLAMRLAYVTQYNIPVKNTVYDLILMGRIPHLENNQLRAIDHDIVENLMTDLGLEDYALRPADRLSGGEFQKVIIARALAQEPELLLLDEPTSSLDIKNQVQVMSMVKRYCIDRRIAVIASIHDINLSIQYSDMFLMLKNGKIYTYGDEEVITTEALKAVYDLDVSILHHKNKKIVIFDSC